MGKQRRGTFGGLLGAGVGARDGGAVQDGFGALCGFLFGGLRFGHGVLQAVEMLRTR